MIISVNQFFFRYNHHLYLEYTQLHMYMFCHYCYMYFKVIYIARINPYNQILNHFHRFHRLMYICHILYLYYHCHIENIINLFLSDNYQHMFCMHFQNSKKNKNYYMVRIFIKCNIILQSKLNYSKYILLLHKCLSHYRNYHMILSFINKNHLNLLGTLRIL